MLLLREAPNIHSCTHSTQESRAGINQPDPHRVKKTEAVSSTHNGALLSLKTDETLGWSNGTAANRVGSQIPHTVPRG